jgi:hypothetical protein
MIALIVPPVPEKGSIVLTGMLPVPLDTGVAKRWSWRESNPRLVGWESRSRTMPAPADKRTTSIG